MPDANPLDVDESPAELNVARELRQRLESLKRAGADHMPVVAPSIIEAAALPPEPAPTIAPPPSPRIEPPRVIEAPPLPPAQPPAEPAVLKRKTAPKSESIPPAPKVAAAASLFGETGFDSPLVPAGERADKLLKISEVVAKCTKCSILAATRNKTAFGDGSPTARLMFIGEAPGAEEDKRGVPFVGRAGQLLTDMITKGMGLRREDVYIANILKCRPPENRDPLPDECANCTPYLEQQLEIIRPEFLCLLGRIASQNLLQTTIAMGKLRGRWHSVRGIKTLVTYHPSYLLRNPPAKKDAWEDLQIIMREMGLPIPPRKS